jgi:hypothetical protein
MSPMLNPQLWLSFVQESCWCACRHNLQAGWIPYEHEYFLLYLVSQDSTPRFVYSCSLHAYRYFPPESFCWRKELASNCIIMVLVQSMQAGYDIPIT